jgi:uncharacterized protein (TIGR01777 family)
VPQTILITGVTGLVGSSLAETLTARGDGVIGQIRGPLHNNASRSLVKGNAQWDLMQARPADEGPLENVKLDAVVHLAGDPVFGLWTNKKKQRIADSRIIGTRNLCSYLIGMPPERMPKTLISASAVGYYGDRDDETLTEESWAGDGFLAETCVKWEHAAEMAKSAGMRVVHLRFGIVLAKKDGALQAMLPAFKMGLGGRLGSGKQWFPWIALEDVIEIILHALDSKDLSGAVNTVSPNPVTNAEFSKALGRALNRPTVLPVPAFALKMLPGHMGQEMFLASERVVPEVLTKRGFGFQYPTLEHALQHVLQQ